MELKTLPLPHSMQRLIGMLAEKEEEVDLTGQGSHSIRILIADSAEIVRRGIRDVLTINGGFTIVGEVERPRDLPEACRNLLPDVTLMGMARAAHRDTGTPELLDALRRTVQANSSTIVIVLVDGNDVDDLMDSIRAGAKGILLRDAPAAVLTTAINDVLDGACALDPRLARLLFERLTATPGMSMAGDDGRDFAIASQDGSGEALRQPLSARELEVLRCMTQGLANKEIASALDVTTGTVKTHACHIFRKLYVNDRTSAVLAGLRMGLLEGLRLVSVSESEHAADSEGRWAGEQGQLGLKSEFRTDA